MYDKKLGERVTDAILSILERDTWRRGYFNTTDMELIEEAHDIAHPNHSHKCSTVKKRDVTIWLSSEKDNENFPFTSNVIRHGCNTGKLQRTEYKLKQ